MNVISQSFSRYAHRVNWSMLLFLLLVVDVKMIVKIAAIAFFIIRDPSLFRDKSIYRNRFTWFYAMMIGLAGIHILLSLPSFSLNYFIAASLGIFCWGLCILAGFIILHEIQKTDTVSLHNTISLFFMLNILVTAGQLLFIMYDAGSLNPYTYQGMQQKYFIGTGDLLTGISFDVSTTNAVFNAMAVLYFLVRHKWGLTLLGMACLLLTASNITLLLLLFTFLYLFIFRSDRNQKSIMVVCFFFLVIFMVKISPQNNKYVTEAYGKILGIKKEAPKVAENLLTIWLKPDSLLQGEEKKQKHAMVILDSQSRSEINNAPAHVFPEVSLKKKEVVYTPGYKPVIPSDNIHTPPFQRKHDTTVYQRELLHFADTSLNKFDTSLIETKSRRLPGKLIALEQIIYYLRVHPFQALIGAGAGNFSSKLAFRTTGLGIGGGYPQKRIYIHPAFLQNHLALYLDYFSKDIEIHSVVNSPNSVYNQLLSEYGIAGITAFLVFYLGYFWKRRKWLSYGKPLLLLILGALAIEYWFEQLSVIIIFELLMLVNIKETKESHG